MIIDDFRSYLVASLPQIGERVHYGNPPQSYAGPYAWFQRSSIDTDTRTFDQRNREYADFEGFDLEIVSEDPNELQTIANEVRKLDGQYNQTFGAGTLGALFVDDHDDSYQPHGAGGQDGRDIASFSITLQKYQSGG